MMARHPLSQKFHALLAEMGEMHDRKQADYGSDADPFANVRAASEWGMPGWVGAMVRVNDKVRRLQAFARKGTLSNESAEDSFMDIAVYSIIALVLYREEGAASAEDFARIFTDPADFDRRCTEYGDGLGRCEKNVGHAGYHLVGSGGATTTWGEA